jgi:sialic acid synthase SpsE
MFKIKNRKLDYKKKAFIIAEIGINHNGDIKKAYKLIDAAVMLIQWFTKVPI